MELAVGNCQAGATTKSRSIFDNTATFRQLLTGRPQQEQLRFGPIWVSGSGKGTAIRVVVVHNHQRLSGTPTKATSPLNAQVRLRTLTFTRTSPRAARRDVRDVEHPIFARRVAMPTPRCGY